MTGLRNGRTGTRDWDACVGPTGLQICFGFGMLKTLAELSEFASDRLLPDAIDLRCP